MSDQTGGTVKLAWVVTCEMSELIHAATKDEAKDKFRRRYLKDLPLTLDYSFGQIIVSPGPLAESDLQIEVTGVAVKITHLATGETVVKDEDDSLLRNKAAALNALATRLAEQSGSQS